jgi:hypothetical protein
MHTTRTRTRAVTSVIKSQPSPANPTKGPETHPLCNRAPAKVIADSTRLGLVWLQRSTLALTELQIILDTFSVTLDQSLPGRESRFPPGYE